jgi:hypothetical protein
MGWFVSQMHTQVFNMYCTTEYNSTCSQLNIIPSRNFAPLPPIRQLSNCILHSSLTRRHSVSEIAVTRVSTDATCIPSKVPWHEETKGNHKEQSLDCMQDAQRFLSPSSAANTGCHDSDEVSLIWRKMMTAFCDRCDLLNREQTTHYHAKQQHNMHH